MAGKFSRSWQIFKSSASVLKKNKKLLLFPLLSSIAALIVFASIPGSYWWLTSQGDMTVVRDTAPADYGVIFATYMVLYSVVIFFNTALVATAAKYMDGGEPGVTDGLREAWDRIGVILGYAAIAATVGVLLRALEERLGFIGQIVINLLGLAWAAATFLVVPLLVHRDIGPWAAVKESAGLLKDTWGENIIANAGMALIFTLFYVPFVLLAIGTALSLIFGAMDQAGTAEMVITLSLFASALLALLLLSLIHAALQGIYGAALYRYATGSQDDALASDFSTNLLADAFAPKRK